LPKKTAKRLRLKATVATGVVKAGSAGAFVTVRFTKTARKALARLRRVKLTAAVSAVSADGRRASLKKALTVAR
jgi:hypothetical protein